MPVALLLDLDDTLVDDRSAMALGVLAFRRDHGLVPGEPDEVVTARWDATGRHLWAEWSMGRMTMQGQRRERLRRTFGLSVDDAEADRLFANYLRHYEQHWRLCAGTRAFLARTERHPRAIVTNGARDQVLRKLDAVGLRGAFQVIVTPDDGGGRKPDAGIFLRALALLEAHPSDAMMIGDSIAMDIEPAAKLGMRTFHVAPEHGRGIDTAIDGIGP